MCKKIKKLEGGWHKDIKESFNHPSHLGQIQNRPKKVYEIKECEIFHFRNAHKDLRALEEFVGKDRLTLKKKGEYLIPYIKNVGIYPNEDTELLVAEQSIVIKDYIFHQVAAIKNKEEFNYYFRTICHSVFFTNFVSTERVILSRGYNSTIENCIVLSTEEPEMLVN
jgi:hypothetical protein